MTTAQASAPSGLDKTKKLVSESLTRFSAVWLLIVFLIVFTYLEPDLYPTTTTLRTVLNERVIIGLLAIALLIPLAAGAFDLTVGATLGLSLVITVVMPAKHGWDPMVAGIFAIAVCAVVGWVNGFLIERLHIDSFIATLGMSQLLAAATLYLTKNQAVTLPEKKYFRQLTLNKFLGLDRPVFYLLIVAIISWYVLEHTPVGRALFATGGNPEAARLAGVATSRLVWGSMVASGIIAGIAGVIYASRAGQASGSEGPGLLFPAFAAVFFGATQIKSRGNVWGTLLALYALGAGVNGLQLHSSSNQYWFGPLFDGAALIIAVAVAQRNVGKRVKVKRGTRNIPPESAIPAAAARV